MHVKLHQAVLGSSELRREQPEELHAAVNAAASALRHEQQSSQIAVPHATQQWHKLAVVRPSRTSSMALRHKATASSARAMLCCQVGLLEAAPAVGHC